MNIIIKTLRDGNTEYLYRKVEIRSNQQFQTVIEQAMKRERKWLYMHPACMWSKCKLQGADQKVYFTFYVYQESIDAI